MIKARIKESEYKIPTKWSEVTFGKYIAMSKTEDVHEVLSITSGIPLEIVKQMEDDQLSKLVIAMGFLNVPLSLEGYSAPEHMTVEGVQIPLTKDIKEKSFGQKIYFHELMKEHSSNLIPALPDIVSIYAQPAFSGEHFDIEKSDEFKLLLTEVFFVDLYSTAINYIEQLKVILENEALTLSTKPNEEQIAAGIDMFEQFGVMNTIKALANNDVTKYAEVERIEYNTVFVHMRMNKAQNDFNENYRKVMKQKQKTK